MLIKYKTSDSLKKFKIDDSIEDNYIDLISQIRSIGGSKSSSVALKLITLILKNALPSSTKNSKNIFIVIDTKSKDVYLEDQDNDEFLTLDNRGSLVDYVNDQYSSSQKKSSVDINELAKDIYYIENSGKVSDSKINKMHKILGNKINGDLSDEDYILEELKSLSDRDLQQISLGISTIY